MLWRFAVINYLVAINADLMISQAMCDIALDRAVKLGGI